MKKTMQEKAFNVFVGAFVLGLGVITLYPLIYVFSMSISDPFSVARGEIWLWPKGLSFEAFKTVLSDANIYIYYYNTIWYTVVGTVLGVLVTALAAYPLSRRNFRPRKFFMMLITFTMFFSGGLITTYLVTARFLGLYNSRWSIVLPSLTTAWYVIVARTFFSTIPDEMLESVRMDGASEYRVFAQFVLPLSAPILSVLALYFAIGYWNNFFSALLYLGKKELHPLALYVRRVVIQSSLESSDAVDLSAAAVMSQVQIKYAVIVVAVLPIILLYPSLSKYLSKGMMVGSLKG